MTRTLPLRADRAGRRGVTLLEVLIAVGVLTFGLLGMAALIPLGRMELAEASHFDNVSSIGRAAFRDLSVRGYMRPEMWADPINGKSVIPVGEWTNPYSVSYGAEPATARMYPTSSAAEGLKGPPFAPLVIDPLMIAPRYFSETPNSNELTSREETHRMNVVAFPYSAQLEGAQDDWPEKTVPRMARVTLRTTPPATIGISGQSTYLSTTMKYDTAQRFFRGTDDLSVTLESDKKLMPIQIFAVTTQSMSNLTLTVSDANGVEDMRENIAYRQFQGSYSWFLVVEPAMAEAYAPARNTMPVVRGPSGSTLSSKVFRVWTVVCHKRDLRDTSNMNLSVDRDVGERCVWVDFVDRNTVRLRINNADRATAQKVLRVKNQQWFAAVGAYPEPALGGSFRYIMEWYRIVNTADDVVSTSDHEAPNSSWYRECTVTGRDFSNLGFEFEDANLFSGYADLAVVARAGESGVGSEPLTAWGILVEGCRGVYEKTYFLDRPSSWGME